MAELYKPTKPEPDLDAARDVLDEMGEASDLLYEPLRKIAEQAYVAGFGEGWDRASQEANCWTEDDHHEQVTETFGVESLPEFSDLLKDLVRALSVDAVDGERLVPYGEVENFFFRTPARDLAALKAWAS